MEPLRLRILLAKLEAMAGEGLLAPAKPAVSSEEAPEPALPNVERLLHIVIDEIKEDLTALADTDSRRDADHGKHIFGVQIKYSTLSAAWIRTTV